MKLERKLAYLRDPAHYPDGAASVEALETHMSWVFLTERHAYKLKKPVHYRYLDFRSVDARRRFCQEEVRLNRRLAPDVYLGVVPLAVDAAGRLRLGGRGHAVDWLVQMRRLPRERMLDASIQAATATEPDLRRVAERLALFYRGAQPVVLSGAEYRALLADRAEDNGRELQRFASLMAQEQTDAVAADLRTVLQAGAPRFDARVAAGRIVEGHGDLRPEHVSLLETTPIIDCLEFDPALRVVDPWDEVGYLALECERLGAPALARSLLDAYATASGDGIDPVLLDYYQADRACTRAKLALWHLDEARFREAPEWPARARAYLALARTRSARARAAVGG